MFLGPKTGQKIQSKNGVFGHPSIEVAKLRSESAYWRKMHQKAVEREAKLKEEIATLYHLNHLRLAEQAPSEAWTQQDHQLRAAVEHKAQQRDAQLAQKELHPACKKVLGLKKD